MAVINLGTTPNDGTGSSARAVGEMLNATGLRKNIFDAVTNPGANDDSSNGFETGSRWVNTATDTVWECLDASAGAAIWHRVLTDEAPQDIVEKTSIGATDRVLLVQADQSPASVPKAAIVAGDGTVLTVVALTAAAYAALTPKVATTLYVVT